MKKRVFGIILAILCFAFLPNSAHASTNALCSFTYDAPNQAQFQVCDDHLSEIKYVEIDFGVDSSVHDMSLSYNTRTYNNQSNRTYWLLGVTVLPYSYFQGVTNASVDYPVTLSFYADNPNGSCPEAEPCPDCSEPSKFIQIIVDAFWKFVVGFAGVISSLIAIFIVFRYIRKVF